MALVAGALSLGVSGEAFGERKTPRLLWGEGTPRYLKIPGGDLHEALRQSAAGANVPLWSGSFTFQGTTFPYTMVGTDPSAGSATSSVPVVIIPVKFSFADGTTLSATDPVCDGTDSAVTLTQNSPVFQDVAFAPGGTYVGTTQYVDAFQRANFWNAVSTASPDYHVRLGPMTVAATQAVRISRLVGATLTGPCAKIGTVNITAFDIWAKQTIKALNVPATSLPLFLSYNTFWTQGGCCILGYHSATSNSQTYSVAAFSDPGVFNVPIQDIHALSHEIGEWMDDPLINNATPGWLAGQASVCQKNLEVGDPVTGIAFTVALNNFTYHPEDLVFLSWFARESPSSAVNGWYTFLNTFATPPAVCH
ncbi:MAG: hypothetical protein HY294_02590 [Candidatus Rokubacteria bacterium]|nr:hypothetical protein [Candidatus Rokubacteria bacterium]